MKCIFSNKNFLVLQSEIQLWWP